MYDPLTLAREIEPLVLQGAARRYYRRRRGGDWYGGIATADCVGCNLRCVFCWSDYPRDHPDRGGKFFSPQAIFQGLSELARQRAYRRMRISGNEPTLGREHLLRILALVERTEFSFVLETNGLLIDDDFARALSEFRCLTVRVSLKGTTAAEFEALTGAPAAGFEEQLAAIDRLSAAGVTVWPAAMASFATESNVRRLRHRLRGMSPVLEREFETEYIILYPHVKARLAAAGIKPRRAYEPTGIPASLV